MAESPKTGSEQLGEAVRRAREGRGMSRRDLAETTGLSYPYISQIETGYRMPSTPAMRALADALGLRPDTLFDAIPSGAGRDEVPGPKTPAGAGPVARTRVPVEPTPAAPRLAPPGAAGPATVPPGPATRSAAARHGGPAGAAGDGSPGPAMAGGSPGPSMAGGSPGPSMADGSPGSGMGGPNASPGGAVDRVARTPGARSADPTAAGDPIDPAAVGTRGGSTAADRPTDPVAGGAPADLIAGAAGGWYPNRSFRPVVARPPAAPESTAEPDQAVGRAAALLTSLPTEERLPALAAVQAQVVRSMIDDEVRSGGSS